MENVNLHIIYLRVHDFLFGNSEKRHQKELQERANSEIQVMEFDGELWLCHRNIPLIKQEWTKENLAKLTEKVRVNWLKYNIQKHNK